jgi:hypothetical protein
MAAMCFNGIKNEDLLILLHHFHDFQTAGTGRIKMYQGMLKFFLQIFYEFNADTIVTQNSVANTKDQQGEVAFHLL